MNTLLSFISFTTVYMAYFLFSSQSLFA